MDIMSSTTCQPLPYAFPLRYPPYPNYRRRVQASTANRDVKMASTDQLLETLEGISSGSFANETERIKVRDALFKALRKTQTPWDLAWEHSWTNPAVSACINTLVQIGVFTKWAEADYQPMTCTAMAKLTGADVVLLRRMMRCLAGQHLLVEVARDTYLPTTWAKSFVAEPEFAGIYGGFHDELVNPACSTLPRFLKETGYVNPTSTDENSFKYWRGENWSFFDLLSQNQQLASEFSGAMKLHSKYNLAHWTEVYPTENIIAAGRQRSDRKLVVDIGGNKGHDIVRFFDKHEVDCPPGSLVLQDLPEVLCDVNLRTEAIELQPYDFFTTQPVKGARVYFMHIIIHDWPDDKAVQILRNVAAAMEKGYSRLLIQESLMADDKPPARVSVLDIVMMGCFSSAERSEAQWNMLLARAGLTIAKIWRPLEGVEGIIEAKLV
ncbi:Demethylsterigmatocystin 6-O-methyltransferase [Cytospora mali]|uniref:Demethylsterigmatocystin 6-O-methyltransferase n=1 Tax=Cytospora mali TaxID=578113 RepID=A0A194W9U0_CYTMA|nr:Demethylsterigmatocystin 6-O-methyltransferase [Valsa mali]